MMPINVTVANIGKDGSVRVIGGFRIDDFEGIAKAICADERKEQAQEEVRE